MSLLLVRRANGYFALDLTRMYDKRCGVIVTWFEKKNAHELTHRACWLEKHAATVHFRLHARQTGCRFQVTPLTHREEHKPLAALRRKNTVSLRWRIDVTWIDKQAAITRTRDVVAYRQVPSTDWEAYKHRTDTVKKEET